MFETTGEILVLSFWGLICYVIGVWIGSDPRGR